MCPIKWALVRVCVPKKIVIDTQKEMGQKDGHKRYKDRNMDKNCQRVCIPIKENEDKLGLSQKG